MTQADQPQDHLDELETQIAEVRNTLDDLRADLSGQGSGPLDSEDVASTLTAIEENEAILDSLQRRRDELSGG